MASAEKVLNSRCSSEFGPRKSHFGTFVNERPAATIIDDVLRCLETPRFSTGELLHSFEDEHLLLGFENSEDPYNQRLLNVESGMQHEAVYLACAAQGVGVCIRNQGINGTQKGEKTWTSKLLIMKMADPYDSGRLTTRAPGPRRPFVSGKNLCDPLRDGDAECLALLPRLATFRKSGSSATEKSTSQLLWAARGRTPHLVKMQRWNLMWGLTVPTWGGVQDFTSVYLVKGDGLYCYVNWTEEFSLINRIMRDKLGWVRGNPTHDIRFVRTVGLGSHVEGHKRAIVLCRNEDTGRALWEVGYMLENMLLEAGSLGVSYESKIFSAEETSELNGLGITDAVAAVLI